MKIVPRTGGVTPVTVTVESGISVPGPLPQGELAAPLVVQAVKKSIVRSNGAVEARVKTSI